MTSSAGEWRVERTEKFTSTEFTACISVVGFNIFLSRLVSPLVHHLEGHNKSDTFLI